MKISKYSVPNPQGKGLIGLLLDWEYTRPRGAVAKASPQLLADYFTSMLVLSAAFKFKPVPGRNYYLYWIDDEWSLSLIAPAEWSAERRRGYVGKCVLHRDMTWTINLSTALGEPDPAMDAIARFHDAFVEKLQSEVPLENKLPSYVAELPYYQRLFASALSRSLKASMTLGGQLSIKSSDWLQQLPRRPLRLLRPDRKDK